VFNITPLLLRNGSGLRNVTVVRVWCYTGTVERRRLRATDTSRNRHSSGEAVNEFRNLSRADYVYEKLREAIKEARYEPGDRVREAEVASWLGVSRTPVREALNRLLSENLLVDSQSRGLIVAELEKQQVLELYALREVLEGTAARLAAQHASESEIESMREVLSQAEKCFDQPESQQALNEYLHNGIYGAAHNRYVSQALHKLADALDLLRGTTYQVPGRPEQAFQEHSAIVEAIANRDPDAADAAARVHMREACRARLRVIFGPRI
jgi:DNA-binding GntR family transcriptional regulator